MPALIKHVGRGARLAKHLSREEAGDAMRYLLDEGPGGAAPLQIGAFLLAMRIKSESPEELAGFVDAVRAALPAPAPAGATPAHAVDVDLHADGRAGRPSVTLAAACIVAALGVPVLVRGAFGQRFAKNDLDDLLERLSLRACATLTDAQRRLGDGGLAILDLPAYAPRLAALLTLREQLGVRTCINSVVKLLDPLRTGRVVLGIFHSPYHEPMAQAARLLGLSRAAVVQAPGGVPEPQPDKPTRITLVDASQPEAPLGPRAFEATDWPIDAAVAPLGPAPTVENADDLARLLETLVRRPADADPGALRMTLATAALFLWAGGRGEAPTDAELGAQALEALRSGAAARVLDDARRR